MSTFGSDTWPSNQPADEPTRTREPSQRRGLDPPNRDAALDRRLTEAVKHALRAPSVHNTQPWRWGIDVPDGTTGTIDLHADTGRHLTVTDPDRRDLLISCGAALHHLQVALAHARLVSTVVRMPDPEDSTHLATVKAVDLTDVAADGATGGPLADLFPAIGHRRTDRRRFSHRPVPAKLIGELVDAAAHVDVLLFPVGAVTDRFAALLAEAADRQQSAPGYEAELRMWTTRLGARDGIPPTAIAHPPPGLAHPSGLRRFPHAQLNQPLPPPSHGGPDDAASFLVLATRDDAPVDQLRAGEALSAVLLTATQAGLACTPLSQATEIGATRDALRHVMGFPEHPQLVLRIGWPATRAAGLHHTPRRNLAFVLMHANHGRP